MGISKTMGKDPSGEKLKKVEASSNYRDGIFQNKSETIVMAGSGDFFKVLFKFLNKPKTVMLPGPLPSIKTDLKTYPTETLFWYGLGIPPIL